MADPIVHITNGVPDGGTGNITTLGQTLVDGANATMGITTGAAVISDATGTLQQYLRGLVKLIASGINVIVTNANSNGQAVMASSAPVVIASNQSTLPAALQSTTAGGVTETGIITTAAANVGNVKASAGQLYKVEISNNSGSWVYLKLYNTAGTPTAGSGTPQRRIGVPPSSALLTTTDVGGVYSTGIGYAITGGAADTDATAVAANILVNFHWK